MQRVIATVDSIPRGSVATYGDVAREAGLPRRARFVGSLLRRLPAGSKLPWHRVVNASGGSSLVGRPAIEQLRRLRLEGVAMSQRGRVEERCFVWKRATPARRR